MRTDIVVIGGYGHVGAQICTLLSGRFPGAVYAAGRSLERAEQFCRSTGGRVKPLQMDAAGAFSADKMRHVKLVVMCLDQRDSSFAEACLMEGIHYIDVTANLAFFGQMAQLVQSGNKYGATALLSVGLAPGLTNLLAGEAKLSMDKVQQLDIAVLLGLGDSHGQAAIEWTVDNLAAQFEVMQNGTAVRADSFTDARRTDWGADLGTRRTYRFPFADQQILPQTLGIPTVSTRLCFDSRAATSGIAALQKLGLLKWLGHRRFRKATVRSFGKIRLGTERYAIKIEALGLKNGAAATAEYVIQGLRESTITAQVAAIAAGTLYSSGYATPGIYHLEQLLRVRLSEDRLSLYLSGQEDAGIYEEITGLRCWSRHSYTD
ncbi:saccharopine dehydrogenase family protein [Paenibacillus sp. HW567]|uniref:saccharopine dehydrogenase family protein n=1 Tax=Paenibacillus sp. HW567 TaxID=1034769 RepID=UPI00037ED774|nr:saccharopine dehydrogenase NADP-binding domain-containing protein [Paenibacillus sp. HW567]